MFKVEKRRTWENLIAVFCYKIRGSHNGGTKLFSEVLSKRQQSQVAARQVPKTIPIGHNGKRKNKK